MKLLAILATILAVILTAAAFGAVAYFGLFVMFVGGIIQIIEACKQVDISAIDVAWGVVRIMLTSFASVVGFWAAFLFSALIWHGVSAFWDSINKSARRSLNRW